MRASAILGAVICVVAFLGSERASAMDPTSAALGRQVVENYHHPQIRVTPSTPAVVTSARPSSVPLSVPARTGYTRQQIRAMPITERPNRVGHFYGNTVRRRSGT